MARKKSKPEATVYYINTPMTYVQPAPPQMGIFAPVQASLQPMPMNQPPFPSMNYQQQPTNTGLGSILLASNAIGDIDLSSSNAAYTLEKLKQDDWHNAGFQNNGANFQMNQQVPHMPTHQIPYGSSSEKMNNSLVEPEPQRIFINRDVPSKFFTIRTKDSDIRDSRKVGLKQETDVSEAHEAGGEQIQDDTLDVNDFVVQIPFSENSYGSDLIFSNGNNREKRRNELFEKYSELHKYKEEHRLQIFSQQKKQIETKIKDLSQEQDENIKDFETIEHFKDLVEDRDYELIKVKLMRNYRRLENLKNYYAETAKVYEEAYNALNVKLVSIKNYLLKQRSLLINLDRDFTEIASSRSNKFYSGFNEDNSNIVEQTSDNEEEKTQTADESNNKYESSETDTGGTSSSANYKRNQKKGKVTKKEKEAINSNNQLLSSILTGFAPLLTDQEFEIITSEDFKSRYKSSSASTARSADADNDEFSSGGGGTSATQGRPKNRGPRVRNTDKDTTIMNKIMKGYTTPDNLKAEEIENDLVLFKLMIKK